VGGGMAEKTKQQAGVAGGGPKKVEMVRRALAGLGKGAKPLQIRAFVKERFGTELDTNLISYYKKRLAGKRKKRQGKKAGAQPKQQPAAAPAGQTKAPAAGRSGINLDDLRLVKDLVGRVGAEQLRGLIDLLAR